MTSYPRTLLATTMPVTWIINSTVHATTYKWRGE